MEEKGWSETLGRGMRKWTRRWNVVIRVQMGNRYDIDVIVQTA
jgi:hypothetical protein